MIVAAGYVLLLSRFELPEERLHFLEYGVVGGLVFAALLERQKNTKPDSGGPWDRSAPLWPAVGASLVTAGAGWIDEGIQAILPNRVSMPDTRLGRSLALPFPGDLRTYVGRDPHPTSLRFSH